MYIYIVFRAGTGRFDLAWTFWLAQIQALQVFQKQSAVECFLIKLEGGKREKQQKLMPMYVRGYHNNRRSLRLALVCSDLYVAFSKRGYTNGALCCNHNGPEMKAEQFRDVELGSK